MITYLAPDPPITIILLKYVKKISNFKTESRVVLERGQQRLTASPNSTAMNRRVIVQRPVVHHIGPHTEGYWLCIRFLYGYDGLLLARRAGLYRLTGPAPKTRAVVGEAGARP